MGDCRVAQGTVCAGGRYDYLIEQLGGKPAPAVGWALGVDRLLELLKDQGQERPDMAPDAYAVVADKNAMPQVLQQLQALRALGVSVQMQASVDGVMASLKSQFKRADASGARFALVFGADELSRQSVTIKPLP
ncbi:MAG: histidine--tRNA ligase, partial [Betaproteobacteria bacterium]|nr:histidine--tRNA ligase [Betaproteobacteria bacterium]